MLKRPYDGAETLHDAAGEAIICRNPQVAAWLERLIAANVDLAASLESKVEFRIVRSEIAFVEAYRECQEALQ